ncbi:membrane protein [Bifidobacterium adolescentis]|nr:membrane protein [Bifidobacterium adolescentis]
MTLCLLHHVGVLKVDGLLLPFMALIPLWGPLSVALMHSRAVLRGGRRIPAGLQELKVEDQEQRNILVDDRTDYANTVPLEEALIVDNPRQRRNLMLSILNENPGQYANLLSQARLNEDVEVVHYAATAMAQISAKEDIALQQRMEEYERNRDSDEALDRYREALEHYLESSMEQGYARTLQMRRYTDLLAERLNGITTTAPYARWRRRRWISVRSMPRLAPSKRRCPHGPRQGDVWLMKLRLEAARHDGEAVQRTVRHIKDDHIYLGGRGHLERVAFFSSSNLTPNGASLSQTILRTTSSFSPTPAVKVITSTPPI